MKKKSIKFEWIEKEAKGKAKEAKKRITITAEEENGQLKLKTVRCFPGIMCIECELHPPCTQLC
jgi:hypothetical protein